MEAIKIANLRSIDDTGYIELKPITLLVGQNSSGKSTFLRTFPLFRQSAEERTTGPILWYGRYVDFGSFSDSLSGYSRKKEISFGFILNITPETKRRNYLNRQSGKYFSEVTQVQVLVTIQNDRSKEDGYVSHLNMLVDNKDKYYISFTPTGKVKELSINGIDLSTYSQIDITSTYASVNTLIPTITIGENLSLKKIFSVDTILNAMKDKKLSKNDEDSLIRFVELFSRIGYEQLDMFTEDGSLNFDPNNFFHLPKELKTVFSHDEVTLLQQIQLLSNFSLLLRDVHNYFISFSKSCTYLAPVRATAERFYRPQNLSVDDVDFQGKNLAVFLRSLGQSEMRAFNRWTEEHFNFSAQVLIGGGQLSVSIKEGGVDHNLADTGFGYSQVLPVITQLWSLVTSKPGRRGFPITYSIEQPELHLHPRMQAKLADALVDSVRMSIQERIRLRLLIETHSETIVNRLGHKIIKGDLDPEHVNIVIFDKNQPELPTTVSIGKYDRNGYLTNWPYGFFEPEFEV